MIRLIIFDFGDTLFHAVKDSRARATGKWEVIERDEQGWPTVVAPPFREGIAEKTFKNVQKILRKLRAEGMWLSIASSADVEYTPKMVEAFEMCTLFRHGFMARGDWNQNCSRKGDWVEAIIHDFNIGELQDDPLEPGEVLFVDDLPRCCEAVRKKVPGINVCLSFPRTDEGLGYLIHVINDLNETLD
ncbi:MAG: hypothetical protein ACTSVI_15010 [Promethearchaeota archaeon]